MKSKKMFFFLLATVLSSIFLSAAYSSPKKTIKILQQEDPAKKQYEQVVKYFESKKYNKAASYIEECLLLTTDERKFPKIRFYEAYCNFYNKAYLLSASQFRHFYKRYPKALEAEEAMYMHAYALYSIMPDIRLDQTSTYNAIKKLQAYLDTYPSGQYATETKTHLSLLNNKLMEKTLQSAVLYYNLSLYRAASISLGIFQQEFPDSRFSEIAAYLKTVSQYQVAKKSTEDEKTAALEIADSYSNTFLKKYPESIYRKDIEDNPYKKLSNIKKISDIVGYLK